jgi:hypothetical protein
MDELFQRVDGLDALFLPFSEQEIDKVINTIPSNKSRRPDGFNGMFLKVCCDIIDFGFYKLYADLWDGMISMQCLNNSLITFVPKMLAHELVNDYKPISFFVCSR